MKFKVKKNKFSIISAFLGIAAIVIFAMPDRAHAVVTNTLPAGVTVIPNNPVQVRSSDSSNTDVGNQSPGNVESVLESAVWFNQPLTFVGGGACGASPNFANGCSAFDNGGGNSNKGGVSELEGNVFGIHYGNNFIAVLYSEAVSNFQINGLRFDVSNIYVFNTVSQVPLPAALPLFLTALTLLGLGGWIRRKREAAAA